MVLNWKKPHLISWLVFIKFWWERPTWTGRNVRWTNGQGVSVGKSVRVTITFTQGGRCCPRGGPSSKRGSPAKWLLLLSVTCSGSGSALKAGRISVGIRWRIRSSVGRSARSGGWRRSTWSDRTSGYHSDWIPTGLSFITSVSLVSGKGKRNIVSSFC